MGPQISSEFGLNPSSNCNLIRIRHFIFWVFTTLSRIICISDSICTSIIRLLRREAIEHIRTAKIPKVPKVPNVHSKLRHSVHRKRPILLRLRFQPEHQTTIWRTCKCCATYLLMIEIHPINTTYWCTTLFPGSVWMETSQVARIANVRFVFGALVVQISIESEWEGTTLSWDFPNKDTWNHTRKKFVEDHMCRNIRVDIETNQKRFNCISKWTNCL